MPSAACLPQFSAVQDMLAGFRMNVAGLDGQKFREHWSCEFWRNYKVPSILKESSNTSALEKYALSYTIMQCPANELQACWLPGNAKGGHHWDGD